MVWITWKWELIGGLIILLLGIFSFFFFNALKSLPVLLAITVPLIILGIIFIITSRRRGDKQKI
jgi:uncharacterized membrane protein HdeD (DUF308 family)